MVANKSPGHHDRLFWVFFSFLSPKEWINQNVSKMKNAYPYLMILHHCAKNFERLSGCREMA